MDTLTSLWNAISAKWSSLRNDQKGVVLIATVFVLMLAAGILFSSNAEAFDLEDAGVVSNEDTQFQGIALVPVPGTEATTESLVGYWFTYDTEGNQVWFVTDLINTSTREVTVNLYKPISAFSSTEGELGDPVGTARMFPQFGRSVLLQFGLRGIDGFPADCSLFPVPVLPSPEPPDLDGDWVCEGEVLLDRVTPRLNVAE